MIEFLYLFIFIDKFFFWINQKVNTDKQYFENTTDISTETTNNNKLNQIKMKLQSLFLG